ncbi:hypothetical protein C2G38_2250226 [Gigaspora rosea]|uniref:Uncharacterized protein n=1 Tax=Gigaspora rosea TaxID=44941 RepID=A0A397UUX8_9GLOM|nr:hypothetical protein C2G38_2250226 [Gigaspora rosea]
MTSSTSSAPTNAERSNNTNIETSSSASPSQYLSSANFASTTRDDSYASLLFLGEDFPKVTPLEDQINQRNTNEERSNSTESVTTQLYRVYRYIEMFIIQFKVTAQSLMQDT